MCYLHTNKFAKIACSIFKCSLGQYKYTYSTTFASGQICMLTAPLRPPLPPHSEPYSEPCRCIDVHSLRTHKAYFFLREVYIGAKIRICKIRYRAVRVSVPLACSTSFFPCHKCLRIKANFLLLCFYSRPGSIGRPTRCLLNGRAAR